LKLKINGIPHFRADEYISDGDGAIKTSGSIYSS
jgi:hypothetical protein